MITFLVELSFALILNAHASDQVRVKLHVTGLQSRHGRVAVAVFADRDAFPRRGEQAAVKLTQEIGQGEVEIELPDLNAGEYAIALFHDENSDGELNTFLGLPKEGFGFSNDARVVVGPPSFDRARVKIAPPAQELEIRMRYLF